MDKTVIESLRRNITIYKSDVAQVESKEDKEDLNKIVNVSESLLIALEENNLGLAKQKVGGFSRNVSDAFCKQPSSFLSLANDIVKVKKYLNT